MFYNGLYFPKLPIFSYYMFCSNVEENVEERQLFISALLPSFGKDGCCNQFFFFTCNNIIFIFLGETNWLMVATGVADCYYNVTDLPTGAVYRFRVACVNKAGQGPYSNLSEKITLDSTGAQKRLPSSVVLNNLMLSAANHLLNKQSCSLKIQNDSEFDPKYSII